MADTQTLTPMNHNSVWEVLHHAMDTIPTELARYNVRSDADFHRDALLGAISFIGAALESSLTRKQPRQYSSEELITLSNFLTSAPELIRGMDTLVDGYNDNHKGADNA